MPKLIRATVIKPNAVSEILKYDRESWRYLYICPVGGCNKPMVSDRTLRHHIATKHPN